MNREGLGKVERFSCQKESSVIQTTTADACDCEAKKEHENVISILKQESFCEFENSIASIVFCLHLDTTFSSVLSRKWYFRLRPW
jgi:hypothetical protein